MAEEKKDLASQREKIYLVVIGVLTITVAVLIWQIYDAKTTIQNVSVQNDGLEDDKQKLTKELNEMLAQYNELETDNAELQADVLEQKEKIEDLLDQVKNNKANLRTIAKYKKEVGTLRTIMKGYVVTIDSLNTANIKLNEDNRNLSQKLNKTYQTNQQLQNEKENLSSIVRDASRLQVLDFSVNGMRERTNGSFTNSSRSQRVRKIKACGIFLENKTAKPGEKEIYMQVTDMQDQVVIKYEGEQVELNGVEQDFSAKRSFNYANTEMEFCLFADFDEALPEGTYKIKLYQLGALIAEHNLVLK